MVMVLCVNKSGRKLSITKSTVRFRCKLLVVRRMVFCKDETYDHLQYLPLSFRGSHLCCHDPNIFIVATEDSCKYLKASLYKLYSIKSENYFSII